MELLKIFLITKILIMLAYGADMLTQFTEERFLNSLGGYLKDTSSALELCKASQIIYPDEPLLEKQNSWTSDFLKQELSSGSIYANRLGKHITAEVVFSDLLAIVKSLSQLALSHHSSHFHSSGISYLVTFCHFRFKML